MLSRTPLKSFVVATRSNTVWNVSSDICVAKRLHIFSTMSEMKTKYCGMEERERHRRLLCLE
jgi:hypothetical protein